MLNVVIEISDNTISIILQPCRPLGVVLQLESVRITVQFDDHMLFDTGEIRDERTNWKLSAKLHAAKLPVAQARPEFLFRRRGLMTHRAGTLKQEGRDAMTRFHDVSLS
jgi:hypothetical protein